MTDALDRRTDHPWLFPGRAAPAAHPSSPYTHYFVMRTDYIFLHIFASIQPCFSACQKTFFVISANVCRGFVSRVKIILVFFHGCGITVLVRREQDSPSDEHEQQTQAGKMRGSPHCPERRMKSPPLREGWDERRSDCD